MNRKPESSNLKALVAMVVLIPAILAASCGKEEENLLYQAEKELFKARKMSSELTAATTQSEFLSKTLDAYRGVVAGYESHLGKSSALDTVIVAAQMELAQLEFQAGLLQKALEDFKTAVRLAEDIHAAKANAFYSSAVISEQLGDSESAIEFYGKFFQDYIEGRGYSYAASLNRRYLVTPLKLGNLHSVSGDAKAASDWYSRAENLYRRIISGEKDSLLVKEAEFNLLASLVQSEKWKMAQERLPRLKDRYGSEREMPSLLYLESRIELDGFGNSRKAARLLKEIEEKYPESREVSNALLARAGIEVRDGRDEEAKEIYQQILEEFPDRKNEAVEAKWMLATIEEKKGNWLEASLHYNSISKDYPLTLQGLEAPLKIAAHFEEIGEQTAAENVYQRAREHYQQLASDSYSRGARILAEKYIVRTLVEEKKWGQAAEMLIDLADEYPNYIPFRENYLRAASIREKELKDKDGAAAILESCIEKFPNTKLAEEAAKQLKRIR